MTSGNSIPARRGVVNRLLRVAAPVPWRLPYAAMFEEPNDDENPAERAATPEGRAQEKFDEFRMHAELAAVFEGPRKFEAQVVPNLDPEVARDVQRTVAKLDKSKVGETPVIDPASAPEALRVLTLSETKQLSTNDYHVHRRPGEAIIVRWLRGEEVEAFYTRLQAHFDAALGQFREEERQQHGWKQDPATLKYLDALDAIDVKMADRYARDPIRNHDLFVLSTQTADEMDIVHLADYVMSVGPAAVVGEASAPPDEGATEQDRAWFFKLFALRGVAEGVERMCFFTFLQKVDDSAGW